MAAKQTRAFTMRSNPKIMDLVQRLADADRRSMTAIFEFAVVEYGRARGFTIKGDAPGHKGLAPNQELVAPSTLNTKTEA